MDIKKQAFRYVDKAAFIILVLLLVYVAVYSPIFGDTFRPVREILSYVPVIGSSSGESFNQSELQKDVQKYEEDIKKRLAESRPPQFPELTQVSQLKAAPAEAKELRMSEWGPPTDIFESPVNITARTPQTYSMKSKMQEGSLTVTKGALDVEKLGGRELKLVGKEEGDAEFEWRDPAGVRHVQPVVIAKFVATAKVSPPTNLRASMDKAAVRLVWDPPTAADPRAPVAKYYVYRRLATESEPKKIGEAPVSEGKGAEGAPPESVAPKGGGTYTDSGIDFDTKYVYVVKSFSPNADPKESENNPSAEIEIPSDTEFFVRGLLDKEGGKKNANFKVWKLMNGKWESKGFLALVPGEEIGAVLPARGGKPGMDFRTGATLVDVDGAANRAVVRIVSRPAGVRGGVLTTEDVVQASWPIPARGKVVYLDKRGELKEKWMGREMTDELDARFPGITVQGAAKPAEGKEAPPTAPPGGEKKGPEVLKPTVE
jgi:hypothetical protein